LRGQDFDGDVPDNRRQDQKTDDDVKQQQAERPDGDAFFVRGKKF